MKKKLISSILILSIGVFFIGCINNDNNVNNTQHQDIDEQKKVSVEVYNAEKSIIEDIYRYSGTVSPSEVAYAITTIPGKVLNVNFDVGDRVNKDSILFEMDATDILNNINVLEASLISANAQIQSAQTAIDTVNGAAMQSQIQSAKSALENTELNYNNTKTTYENNKALYDAGIISKTDFDKIELAYKSAELQYNQAKESYNIIADKLPEENLRKANDAYNVAVSSKASIEAQIKSAQKSLEDAKIKSPIDGIISECNVVAGTVVTQSQPQFTIINMDNANVTVNVSEHIINSIKVGDKVNLSITAFPNMKFEGTVKTVSPAANSTGTYTVEVKIPNKNNKLKAGMFGEVEFVNEKSYNSFVLPRDAIINKDDEKYIYVVENEKAKKVVVETGIDTGDKIEITNGIEAGMQVIVKGQNYVVDGTDVQVILKETEVKEEE